MPPAAYQINGITILLLLLLSSSSSSSYPFYIRPSDRNGMTRVPCNKN
jgi:hypothetical protein